MRKTVSVFSLRRAAAIVSLVALACLAAAYPASLHAQTGDAKEVENVTKPVNVSAELVQGSTSADGSTVKVRLEWEEHPDFGNQNRTGFCYEVRGFQAGVQVSGREHCRTSTDNSVEFRVSSSWSSVELQVRFVFSTTHKGTNSDTVTVTLSG